MEHPTIDDQDVVERYLRGRLAPEEAHAFELHYLHCEACLDQLEAAEEFAAAVKRAAAAGLDPDPAPEKPAAASTKPSPTWRFAGVNAPPSRFLAFAALLLLACGLPLLLLASGKSRADAEVADLRRQLEAAEQRAVLAEDGRQALARQLAEQAEAAAKNEPAIGASLLPVFLGALRGDDQPGVELEPPAGTETVLLIFELAGPDLASYRVRLLRQDHELWSGENLHPNELGLTVAVPRKLLEPGSYRLEVAGSDGRRELPVGRRGFRVR